MVKVHEDIISYYCIIREGWMEKAKRMGHTAGFFYMKGSANKARGMHYLVVLGSIQIQG